MNVLREGGSEKFSGQVTWTSHVLLRLQKHVGLMVLAQLFDPDRLSRAVGDKDLRRNGRRISQVDYAERYGDDYDPGAEYWETALGLYVVGPNTKVGPGMPPRAVITLLERKSVSRLVNYGRRRTA